MCWSLSPESKPNASTPESNLSNSFQNIFSLSDSMSFTWLRNTPFPTLPSVTAFVSSGMPIV